MKKKDTNVVDIKPQKTISEPPVEDLGLRDMFAAHALSGITSINATNTKMSSYIVAKMAYIYADMMMEVRHEPRVSDE